MAADPRRYWNCRLGALRALADLGHARPEITSRISEEINRYLDDPDYLVRSRVPQAIVALGADPGVGALRRAAEATPDPRLAHGYLMAAELLASQRKRGEAKEMREAIHKLEERGSPGKKPTGPAGPSRRAGRAGSREMAPFARRAGKPAPAVRVPKKPAKSGSRRKGH